MKYLTVDAYKVKPCQPVIRFSNFKKAINDILTVGYSPIPVLRIGSEYLMGDGHHTSSGLVLLNDPLDLIVLENNKEIRDYKKGMFCRYQTFDEAIDGLSTLRIEAEELGVYGIGDILVYDEISGESLKRVHELDLDELIAKEKVIY
jgi:hypothetical protein